MEKDNAVTIASGSDRPQTDAAANVNPDLPEQAIDANPSSADTGTAGPTSPQDDTSEAEATKDEARAASQDPAAPSNSPKNDPLPAAEGSVTQPGETDDGGCFEPYVRVPPAPKPAPEPKPPSLMPLTDKILRDNGCVPTPTDTSPETEFPAPATAEGTGDTELAQPSEVLPTTVEAPIPPPRVAAAGQLIKWIKRVLLAQTILPEDAAELVAFWVILTWLQDAMTVLPSLVLTGAPHQASRVLRGLSTLCCEARLLSGFQRSHLGVLQRVCKTNLVWEPNLDKRTATLLSNMTDRNFVVVEHGSLISCARATAIYAGANPETHPIENAIRIHIAPTIAGPPARPQWLHKMIDRLPVHLEQYRDMNLSHIRLWTWAPSGLSPESAAIAAPLGRCATNAPELR